MCNAHIYFKYISSNKRNKIMKSIIKIFVEMGLALLAFTTIISIPAILIILIK